MISEQAQRALARDRTIDMTTVGRRSGRPRRLEIWFHNLDGRIYISGLPGRRDWYANVLARPEFTFHLKESAQVDIPLAHARSPTRPNASVCCASSSRDLVGKTPWKIGLSAARSSKWSSSTSDSALIQRSAFLRSRP